MKAKFLALVALVLGLASCQNDPEGFDVTVNGEVSTTVTVNLADDSGTRATASTNSANSGLANLDIENNADYTLRYILQVFDQNGETSKEMVVKYSNTKNVAFDVRLVPNRHYNFVVWADIVEKGNEVAEECAYDAGRDLHYTVVDHTLQKVTLNGDWKAMDETRDAYTGVYSTKTEDQKYTATSSINLTLTRPFAKLRVVTTDMAELFGGVEPAKATVEYTTAHYNAFNALEGKVIGDSKNRNIKHEGYEIKSYNDNEENQSMVLFTDYFFAKAEQEAIQFTLSVVDGNDNPMRTTYFNTDIPVKRNYLTTISGNVLTDGNNVKVKIDDNFNENTFDVIEYSGNVNETIVLNTGVYILRDLNMNISSDNAIIIAENAKVTIDVVGKINLEATKEAIKVCDGATLTINGMQTTRSNDGKNGEIVADGGIGGNNATININNIANLTAKGNGDHAFGIGGTNAIVNINNTTIKYVSGGHVQALFENDEKYGKSEPEGGAAIGGSKVTINNSTITKAEGGSKSAAIGNTYWQSTEVVIKSSNLVDIFGGNASAAIGGSRYSSEITAENKQSIKIKIENSTITNAVGGQFGAGIGSGYDTHCAANETNSVNEIIIVTSNVTAQGGKYAAGIGTGFHAAALTGSIDTASTINATSGEPFYKGTYTFAQHIGYGVIDPAREGKDLDVEFTVADSEIAYPVIYATHKVVNNIDELTAALNATAEGNNAIFFGADIEGNAIVNQQKNHNVIIDGCGKKYSGTIFVEGNNLYPSDETVVVKNIAFEITTTAENDTYFIQGKTAGNSYPHNITIKDCSFSSKVQNNHKIAGISFQQFYQLNIDHCSAENLHSLLQVTSCDNDVTVTNVTVTNCKNGVSFGNTMRAKIENSTISVVGYGVRAEGTDAREVTLDVTGCDITAYIPVSVRKLKANAKKFTLNIGEDNTFTKGDESLYQIAVCSNEYEAGVEAQKPASEYEVNGADKFALFPAIPVAKIGSTEYTNIDEAIAAWTNGTTLTLKSDVTLNDVIKLKSTEHHILNLSTYTMTAASGKHAIEITCDGRSSASYALTVNADSTNPGGITATGKSCIYYKKSDSTKDRPIILINNGVFTGSYSINSISNGNTNCPQIWINGGVFNSYMNLTKNMLKVSGGTFHGAINCTGDSSAYREIKGGRFKSWQFMTADAPSKFWVGSGNGNYDVGVYVDDEGYLVVGGPVITEFGDKFEAKASNYSKWSSYLQYSSAAEHGLYYTNAAAAIDKHGEANVEVKK